MHVGETEVPSLKEVGEAFVIHAQKVKQRGEEVAHVNTTLPHDVLSIVRTLTLHDIWIRHKRHKRV